ncbi:condensin complex subunit 3 [Candida albicans 19F]|nr:condensin complex subunit 3 [Candida albicans 19F]
MDIPPKPTLKAIKKFRTLDEIKYAMKHVFQDAQLGLAGHRKLVVILKNVFKKAIELNQINFFAMCFTKLLSKVLPLKRGVLAGDRIVKFCYSFVNGLVKDANEEKRSKEEEKEEKDKDQDKDTNESDKNEEDQEDQEGEGDQETPISEFISYLIKYLLSGIEAKDKSVRYRVVQTLAYLVEFLTEIHENNTLEALYTLLSNRLQDKESSIRIQAVVALSHFQLFEFSIEGDTGEFEDELISSNQIQNKLINSIQNDDSPEVRRAALMNLVKTQDTIPILLERARDSNSINRRLVYSKIARELITDLDDLEFEDREFLLKWGLNDRDETVKAAATKMLTIYWYQSVNEDLLELIDQLNVKSAIAEQAILAFFKNKPEVLETIKIDESYWKNLTTEKAFLMRTFYQYCNENQLHALMDANFPELLDLSITLEKYLSVRLKTINENENLVKTWETYNAKIDELDDQIFSLENQISRINTDADNFRKSLSNIEEDIIEINIAKDLFKKRIKQLKNNSGNLEDLITEENQEIADQIKDFSMEDLQQQLEDINKNLDEIEHQPEDITAKLEELQTKYDSCIRALETTSELKIQTVQIFEQEHENDCIPFVDALKELEFIINQLLLIVKDFDYGDEMARRKLLHIIRMTLTEDKLPDGLISVALRVLRALSINEKDFVSMAVEIITDIRDSRDDEEFHSAAATFDDDDDDILGNGDDESQQSSSLSAVTKKRRIEPDMPPDDIVLRCLTMTQYVLEVITHSLDDHLSLSSIYSGIVNYAIQNESKKKLYLAGLTCLGLYSLIDSKIARIATTTLLSAMRSNGEEVKEIGMKAIVDILAIYGMSILDKSSKYKYSRMFFKVLNSFDAPKLQCIVAEGLCKLFLADILYKTDKRSLFGNAIQGGGGGGGGGNDDPTTTNDDETEEETDREHEKHLFEAIVLIYFNPNTKSNQELQQILSFCIPVYAFSHINHQINLAAVSGDVIYRLFTETETELSPSVIIPQLISWCDPRNLVKLSNEEINQATSHLWQCVYLLQVVEQVDARNVKRCIINNLNKFHITEELESNQLQALIKALDATVELFTNNEDNPNFILDKPTKKNFDTFIESIKNKLEIAQKREENESIKSGTNSILHELDDLDIGTGESSQISIKSETKRRDSDRSSQVSKTTSPETSENEDEEDDNEEEEQEKKKSFTDGKNKLELKADKSITFKAEDKREGSVEIDHGQEQVLVESKKAIDSNVEDSLKDIDKFLEEADDVDYGDISMDD